ncbi:MAG TPA: CrcB family protein [Mycobacteriales bacterium]|nr:CrcB family protein [Mycobacteriales bacterium]
MTVALLVALAAGAGAVLRHLVTVAVARRWGGTFPAATLGVNVLGSFLAGLVVGAARSGAVGESTAVVATAGLLGGFTTLSTWAVDTVALSGRGERGVAAWNVAGTLGACVLAAAAGVATVG